MAALPRRGPVAMASLPDTLDRQLQAERGRPRWVVAFSGGLDSTALLHALFHLPQRPPLHALHIHHGLQAQADDWLAHCQAYCQSLGVTFSARHVVVESAASVEAAARAARYRAFEEFLGANDLLLQGHHLDDQAETLLLRLFRGTGPDGLRGMPASRPLGRGALRRPLLTLPRRELEAYARAQHLQWLDDPSNSDPGFDRNYLRHQVLPLVAARWPAYRQTLSRLGGLMERSAPALADDALLAFRRDSAHPVISLQALRAMAEPARFALLRRWLSPHGITPTLAQLQALQGAMLWSAGDAEPVVELDGWQLRRFQDRLYLTALTAFDAQANYQWDGLLPLDLPGAGQLSADCQPGAGECRFEVGFRRGGERCQPSGRGHSQQLKKLLQEAGLPPWLRQRLPLIFVQGQLAAVADLWVCRGFEDQLAGWRFHWQPEC